MALGVLGTRSLGAVPAPRIDLGPECVPGYPCSERAAQRQLFERGLTAFLDRARNPPGALAPQNDPFLQEYQRAAQDLSPDYRAELTNQAQAIATTRSGTLARRGELMQSAALRGPYFLIPAPGPFLMDAARAGMPVRFDDRG